MIQFPIRCETSEGRLFVLRPWLPEDQDSLTLQANNPNIARFMTDQFPHPFTAEKAAAFIERAGQNTPPTILAIDLNGMAVGGIGLHPGSDVYRNNAEMGYWLGEDFWGKGIITAAIKAMVQYGFSTLPVQRIYARPYGNNPASQKALLKAGFTLEARLEKTILKNEEELDEWILAVRRHKR